MTVFELIEALQKFPPNSVVMIPVDQEDEKWDGNIKHIIDNEDGTIDLDNWPEDDF